MRELPLTLLRRYATVDRDREMVSGDVMRDNLPMLALARKLGFVVHRHPDDATLVRVIRATASGSLQ